jgi:hypothetical protein
MASHDSQLQPNITPTENAGVAEHSLPIPLCLLILWGGRVKIT